jgi:hypothetical protein
MICNVTKKTCANNCASNSGGYAGDDCFLVHKKFEKQHAISNRVIVIMLILSMVAGLIYVVYKQSKNTNDSCTIIHNRL